MHKKPSKIAILILLLFSLNILGGVVIALKAHQSLEEYSQHRTRLISGLVKGMVSDILYVFYQDMYRYTDDCNSFLDNAQHMLLKVPYIRSINISDEQYVYCSTISGKKRTNIQNYQFPKQRLSLLYLEKSPLFNETDVILLNLRTPNGHHIVFGMHTYIFRSFLQAEMNYFSPQFIFNNYVMSQYLTPEYTESPSIQVKNDFVSAGYNINSENYINYLLVNYSTSYIVLLLVTIFAGSFLYHFIVTYDFMRIGIAIALRRKLFQPFYQAIIDHDGNLHGVEVLARWADPLHGVVSPAEFIPTAEKSGQINQIFTQLVDCVTRDLKKIQHRLPEDFHLALNVSAPQLLTPSLANDCRKIIYTMNRSDVNLVLELTERVEIPFDESYAESIRRLKALGIFIALDDFGTGHSSLKYIKSLKIDLLKLDKSFVDMISNDDSEDHIVANVLDLAKRIQIPVVAEGIESKFQHDYLLEHEVEYFQGYYFSKPLAFDEFKNTYLINPN